MENFYQMTLDEYFNPSEVDVRGLMDDGYCPICSSSLDDLVDHCPNCGKSLSWERWKIINNI